MPALTVTALVVVRRVSEGVEECKLMKVSLIVATEADTVILMSVSTWPLWNRKESPGWSTKSSELIK